MEDRPGPGRGTDEGCWTPGGISDVWKDPSRGGGDGMEWEYGVRDEGGGRAEEVRWKEKRGWGLWKWR